MKTKHLAIHICLLATLLVAPSAHAQFQWANRIASIANWPEGEPNIGLALDTNDNCYVTGYFDDTNDFGGVALTNQSVGGSDVFLAKYNSTGALQWVQQAGASVGNVNYGRGAGVDTNGNIYVTGGYQGPAKFGGVNLAATSGEQFFLAKYNSAGTVQWVQSSTGGNGDNNGIGLAVDNAGNSYALAVMDYSGTSITFGTKTVTDVKGGTTFAILVKYNNAGAAQWAQLFDTSQETYATKLAVDAAGNVYVRGTFYSDMTIESSSLTVSAGSTQNAFIAKFNNSGTLIWVQQPQGGNVGEGGVAVDPAGNVFVSGYFNTDLDFGGGITLTNGANNNALFGDAFLAKYNSAGAIQWAQSAGGANGGFYWDLALDAHTNIYAAGFLGYDAAIAKYNPAGTLQWTYSSAGPPANPVSSGVFKCAVDSTGNSYLAGFYQGTATFGATTLQSQEAWNFFLTQVSLKLLVATTSLPDGTVGVAYSQTLTASGGQTPYTWTNISGGLPPGLTLAANGVISGTPTTVVTTNFTVQVKDATNGIATQSLSLTIQAPAPLQITTTSLPNGTVGVAYNQTLAASGGQTPYTWTNTSGALPPGLTLATNGLISGTPTTTDGTFNFTVKLTDALSTTATQPLTLTVFSPPGVTLQPTNNVVTVSLGNSVTLAVAVTGTGPFSYQWQLNGTNLPNGIINTVAGNGMDGYLGDGGAATNAELYVPQSVYVDAAGNLFIADSDNNCIREVDANGIITTVAGNGTNGYSGDGGAATNAELSIMSQGPLSGVAMDAGNLFIADWGNNRVREVGINGIITTVAGNGTNGYSGDGGAATNAELYYPSGVAVDATGDLFIADWNNGVIREVGTNGIVATVAGGGSDYPGDGGAATNAELDVPSSVAVDANGNLFIVDQYGQFIRKVGTNGIITTVAGNGTAGFSGDGGPATNAELNWPEGVAVDATGNLFIADTDNNVIREVGATGIITTIAGNGTAGFSGDGGTASNAELNAPASVVVDATGNLFIADSANTVIRKVTMPGPTLTLNNVGLGNVGAYDVVVTGSYGSVTSNVVNVTLALEVTTTGLPNGTNNAAYSQQLSAAYGQPPYSWSLIDGSLPSGLTLTTNGLISGTPTTNGTYNLTVQVTDATNNTATQMLALTVFGPPSVAFIQPTNNSIMVATGSAVSLAVSVMGTGPFSYQWQFDGTNLYSGSGGIITTVAGGYLGDGGAATNASLMPQDMAVDGSGNLFIADGRNNRIRKIGANGIITTVAGGGNNGLGDGGAATNAELSAPTGVAVDTVGNLFIVDKGNFRLRKVDTNGSITTVAGNGDYGYFGDGGPATNASLNYPEGVAVDATGNLFIADVGNQRIRKVDTHGIITTVAGNGAYGYSGDGGRATNASLNYPERVAVDARGNLFIADYVNNRIRQVGTNGIITTVAGNGTNGYSGDGGSATNASLFNPSGVAVDGFGNLYIADIFNFRIRRVGTNDLITTVAGGGFNYPGYGGPATNAILNYPEGVAVDGSGNLFLAADNDHICMVNTHGIITSVAGGGFTGDGGPATNAILYGPTGVAADGLGDLFIADSGNNLIRRVDPNGILATVAGDGTAGYSGDGGLATNASLNYPGGVAVDGIGNLFIADSDNNVIRRLDTNGLITTFAGGGWPTYPDIGDGGSATNASLGYPWDVAVDGSGNVFIADAADSRIRKVDINGLITTVAGNGDYGYFGDGGPATNSSLNYPEGVAVDGAGNLFIADTDNNVIRRVDTNGIITTVAGGGFAAGTDGLGDGGPATNAFLNYVPGVAVDGFGNLFIADSDDNLIRQVNPNGIITCVAGNGEGGYSGDGGPATNATLNGPTGLTVDGSGDLFIADSGNSRIRKVIIPSPTLVLNDVNGGNSGAYDLVVSSPYGSVTSSVVNLTVTLPLALVAPQISVGNNLFSFLLSGPAGSNYVLEVSTNLLNWNPVSTSSIPVSGNITVSNAISGYNNRFYRVFLK